MNGKVLIAGGKDQERREKRHAKRQRDGLELAGTFTATVDIALSVGSVAETLTVTGDAPIVDPRPYHPSRFANSAWGKVADF
jgi:hypothetical protein